MTLVTAWEICNLEHLSLMFFLTWFLQRNAYGGGGGAGAFCIKRCIAVGRNEHKEWPEVEGNVGVEDRPVAVNIITTKVNNIC